MSLLKCSFLLDCWHVMFIAITFLISPVISVEIVCSRSFTQIPFHENLVNPPSRKICSASFQVALCDGFQVGISRRKYHRALSSRSLVRFNLQDEHGYLKPTRNLLNQYLLKLYNCSVVIGQYQERLERRKQLRCRWLFPMKIHDAPFKML